MALTSEIRDESPEKSREKGHKYEVRRIQILDAAASVFAELGYLRASTGDIAARLGMRQSNLYYYVRSKDEALAEICLAALKNYIHNISDILERQGPFPAKLRAAVSAHLEILTERPDHFVTFLTCRHELPDKSRREVGTITRAYEALLEQLLAEGIAGGELTGRIEPQFAASCLMALCHNPLLYRKIKPGPAFDRAVDDITFLFLNGILPTDKTT